MNTINTLNGVILASRDEVTEHAENTAVHLTEEERTMWNAKANASQLDTKADASALTAHETNTTVHVSQEEKEKWNARTTKGIVAATQDGLDEHTENTTVHITEEERTAWNNKTDASSIPPLLHRFGESLSLGSAVPAEYAAVGSDEVFSFRHTLLLGGIDHSETKEPVLSVTHPDKSGNYAFGSREVYDALMHPSCDNLHITSEERTAWNAKVNVSALSSKVDTTTFDAHVNNPTVHFSWDERAEWSKINDLFTDDSSQRVRFEINEAAISTFGAGAHMVTGFGYVGLFAHYDGDKEEYKNKRASLEVQCDAINLQVDEVIVTLDSAKLTRLAELLE